MDARVFLVFHYFPFLACGILLLNLWVTRQRLSASARVYPALFAAFWLMWGFLELAGGYGTFFFVLLDPRSHPLVTLFWAIFFLGLWSCSAWIIWGNGAEETLRAGLVHGSERLQTPRAVRLFFAAWSVLFPILVTIGFLSGVFGDVTIALGQIFPY